MRSSKHKRRIPKQHPRTREMQGNLPHHLLRTWSPETHLKQVLGDECWEEQYEKQDKKEVMTGAKTQVI